MTYLKAFVAGLCVLNLGTSALAQMSADEDQLLRAYRAASAKGKEKILQQARTSATTQDVSAVPIAARESDRSPSRPASVSILNKNTPSIRASGEEGRAAAPVVENGCSGLKILLRQDWKDIGYIGCPETTDKAKGAELSYAYDRVAANQIWTARGTAGIFFSSILDAKGKFYESFGAYLTVNRVLNSAPAAVKGDSDKMAFGGAVETAFKIDGFGSHYLRLRGGVIEDRLKNTSSGNITGEWTPVYTNWPGYFRIHDPYQLFNRSVIVSFDPVFLVQYNAALAKDQLLDFNGRTEAFRVGPQLTLNIYPGPNSFEFLSRFSGSVNYHWAYEAFSRRGIAWFDTAITYNIDAEGQVGITGSYKKGRDEDTGTATDIYKIALTGKI
jgi:hypothetical protein